MLAGRSTKVIRQITTANRQETTETSALPKRAVRGLAMAAAMSMLTIISKVDMVWPMALP